MSPEAAMEGAKCLAAQLERHRFEVARVEVAARLLPEPRWQVQASIDVRLTDTPEAVSSQVATVLAELAAPQARVILHFLGGQKGYFTLDDRGERSA